MAPSATLTRERRTAAPARRRPLRIALGALAVMLGLGGVILGGLLFTAAHATHPVQVDGTVADYQAITINGSYARNDLRLAGDSHTYTFDGRQFHPALPERFQKDARIQLWVDQGTTNVLALTLYDEMGLNATAYTTGAYDNPTVAYYGSLAEAGGLAALGVVLLLGGGATALFRSRRQRVERSQERSQERGSKQGASQEAALGAARPKAGAGQRVPAVVLPASAAPPASQDVASHASPYAPPNLALGALPGAIPTAQAVPTTPMPGRQPLPPRPAIPAASVDEIPTQKAPAMPMGMPQALPPAMPPGNGAMSDGATPWAAWGVAPQPSAPGTLPDFPTERLPSAAPASPPGGDVSDQPTRKSETARPPDPGHGA
ncbi:MAG TPA: hypothetical protein VIG30_05675 [Ktedonobacterales bacterium]|jgi:hypothetical protein